MKTKIFTIFLLVVSEFFTFIRWQSCWIFNDTFHFTASNLKTRLILSTNPEGSLPIIVVRAFHNKVTEFVSGYFLTLLQYIDIRFLYEFIGIAGAVGVYLGFWNLFTKKHKNFWIFVPFLFLFLLSSVELIFNPNIKFFYKIVPFVLIFCSISIYGWWEVFKVKYTKTIFMFFFIILIFSVLSIIFLPDSLYLVCLKA